jgi:hypothetical protein
MSNRDLTPPIEKPHQADFHCRHYSYSMTALKRGEPGPRCAIGQDLSASGAALKCMPDPRGPRCELRQEWTPEERDAWDRFVAAGMERAFVIMQAIPKQGDEGDFQCPACGGKVLWSRSRRNGHLSAHCTTPFCFSAIQ